VAWNQDLFEVLDCLDAAAVQDATTALIQAGAFFDADSILEEISRLGFEEQPTIDETFTEDVADEIRMVQADTARRIAEIKDARSGQE